MSQWLGKVQWDRDFLSQDLEIVLIGDRRSLDSPLLRNLLGKYRATSKTSLSASTSTRDSTKFLIVDKVKVRVHLVPTLSDATGYKDEGYILRVQPKVNSAHLVIYCVDMSDTRLRGSVLRTLQKVKMDMSRTVMVLTFADALPALMRHWESPNFPKCQYFNSKLTEWTTELKAMLRHVGVDQEVVAKMKVYPSANEPDELLPNGDPWLAPLSLAIMGIVAPRQKEAFLEEHAMLFPSSAGQQLPPLSLTDAAAEALATLHVRGRSVVQFSSVSDLHTLSVLSEDQSRSINAALRKLREDCPVFGILVVGRTGVGKSTLINNLLGREVATVGHRLQSETPEVYAHEYSVEGVAVVVYDTPGLGDVEGEQRERKHLEIMKNLLARGKIHLVVYCFQMNETMVKSSLLGTLQKYHAIGVDWGRSMIALTFADALYVPKRDQKHPGFKMSSFFKERLDFWQSELRQELVKTVGVHQEVVKELKICPTTPVPKDPLPNGSRWYVPLWLDIVDILPPEATVRFVDMHRGNICDTQTLPLRNDPNVEVNLDGEDMIRFASRFATAIKGGYNEPMPSQSGHARVEVHFVVITTARDIQGIYQLTEQMHPSESERCPQRRCQPTERIHPSESERCPQRRCQPTERIHPSESERCPQRRCQPTERIHPSERCPQRCSACCNLCCLTGGSRDEQQ